MAYVAVDTEYGNHPIEFIYLYEPKRSIAVWMVEQEADKFPLPKGSIEKLIGKKLTWEDEPVELKETV